MYHSVQEIGEKLYLAVQYGEFQNVVFLAKQLKTAYFYAMARDKNALFLT